MTSLPLAAAFVLLAIGVLVVGAAFVRWTGHLGPAVGASAACILLGALALGVHRPELPGAWLVLDVVSLPLVPLTGIALATLLGVLPVRERDPDRVAALLVLGAVHLGLAVAPMGAAVGFLWVAEALTSAAVLTSSTRRLAAPYLMAGALVGLTGLMVGGRTGGELLILAIAIRLGVPPFQTWIVGAFTRGPTLLAVALASPMAALSLGVRVPLGEDPYVGGAITYAFILAALLAAGLAVVQVELGRAVGMFTVSVAAAVTVGVLDAEPTGHLGGVLMWGLSGLALLGLGATTAAVRSRVGDVPIGEYQGLAAGAPTLGGLFLVFGLAAVGAPGTADFVSGELVLHGGLAAHPISLVTYVAAVSAQGYAVLHLFSRAFLGPPRAMLSDVLPRERAVLALLAGALLAGGLFPQPWIDGLRLDVGWSTGPQGLDRRPGGSP